tara:strand:- start:378 stop:665 length:288 start_codon:yes stop_codon:yes gene_type:complete
MSEAISLSEAMTSSTKGRHDHEVSKMADVITAELDKLYEGKVAFWQLQLAILDGKLSTGTEQMVERVDELDDVIRSRQAREDESMYGMQGTRWGF